MSTRILGIFFDPPLELFFKEWCQKHNIVFDTLTKGGTMHEQLKRHKYELVIFHGVWNGPAGLRGFGSHAKAILMTSDREHRAAASKWGAIAIGEDEDLLIACIRALVPHAGYVPQRFKRILDLTITVPALVLLSPLLLVLALVTRLGVGTRVFCSQHRVGREGRYFWLRTFRTMTEARDSRGRLLPKSERRTRVGRFLHSTGLENLPQLWNVLRGEMSLVGPRPLPTEFMRYISPSRLLRQEVLPGIITPSQARGENWRTLAQMFTRDISYAQHWSLWGDVRLLARTAWPVGA